MNQNKIYQLDFWKNEEESQMEALEKRVDHIADSTSRVRKKLFGENGKLNKRLTDLEDRFAIIESNLCRGKL